MAENMIFDSAVRSTDDKAGVFEYDGETAYFYLYETKSNVGHKIVGTIHIMTGMSDFEQEDVAIHWDGTETKVGLFIRGQLWAVFDVKTDMKYGGDYRVSTQPGIPAEITNAFSL
jgi:hypothetical protein